MNGVENSFQKWILEQFPRKNYVEKKNDLYQFPAHYVILYQPEQTACKYIESLTKENRRNLLLSDQNRASLTSLHLAVIFQKIEVVQKIFSKWTLPLPSLIVDHKDGNGWYAVHHIVWAKEDKKEKLKKIFQASLLRKTLEGDSLEDLEWMFQENTLNISSCKTWFRNSNQRKKISEFNENDFQQLGIKKWSDTLYCPIGQEFFFYQERTLSAAAGCTYHPSLKKALEKELDLFKKSPHELEIQGISDLKEIALSFPWKVVTLENLSYQVCLGRYSGILQEKSSFFFSFDHITAKEQGNFTRFFRHGFPNLFIDEIQQRFYVSDEKGIKKGEELIFNYGVVFDLNEKPHLLLRKEEMKAFFSSLELVSFIQSTFLKDPRTIETLSERAKIYQLLFPLNSPLAMLYLHLEGSVPIKIWWDILQKFHDPIQSFMRIKSFFSIFLESLGVHQWFLFSLIKKVKDFDEEMKDKELLNKIKKWLIVHLEEIGPWGAVFALEKFEKDKKLIEKEKELDKLLEELENYDLEKKLLHCLDPNVMANMVTKLFIQPIMIQVLVVQLEENKNENEHWKSLHIHKIKEPLQKWLKDYSI